MNDSGSRRNELRSWLGLRDPLPALDFEVFGREVESGYERVAIRYAGHDGDVVCAWLLLPHGVNKPAPGVVIHHQHNGQRHLGKSEVCGLAGDPLQAFGPVLAARGIVVIAADSICFEDRRMNCQGTEPHPDDWLQHYNEMAYRLLRGETLMRKVLEDAEAAVSVLAGIEIVDPLRIGVLGHSYGGNTTLFQSALDVRPKFACSSGAVCSYRDKIRSGTGIEMAEVLPGALNLFEIDDLLRLVAPRQILVVSATDDKYSRDADEIVLRARDVFSACGKPDSLQHFRYEGDHALTSERCEAIIAWLVQALRRLDTVQASG